MLQTARRRQSLGKARVEHGGWCCPPPPTATANPCATSRPPGTSSGSAFPVNATGPKGPEQAQSEVNQDRMSHGHPLWLTAGRPRAAMPDVSCHESTAEAPAKHCASGQSPFVKWDARPLAPCQGDYATGHGVKDAYPAVETDHPAFFHPLASRRSSMVQSMTASPAASGRL